jgi:predicted nucleic acid-binding protein
VVEVGTPTVQAILDAASPVATATLAYAEVHAGLARKRRSGGMAAQDYSHAERTFEHEWGSLVRVQLDGEVLRVVRHLVKRHPLRGADAVHLASAIVLARSLGEPTTFGASDQALLRAAAAERLEPLNVETDRPGAQR